MKVKIEKTNAPNGNGGIVPPWLIGKKDPKWDEMPKIPELDKDYCEESDLSRSGRGTAEFILSYLMIALFVMLIVFLLERIKVA